MNITEVLQNAVTHQNAILSLEENLTIHEYMQSLPERPNVGMGYYALGKLCGHRLNSEFKWYRIKINQFKNSAIKGSEEYICYYLLLLQHTQNLIDLHEISDPKDVAERIIRLQELADCGIPQEQLLRKFSAKFMELIADRSHSRPTSSVSNDSKLSNEENSDGLNQSQYSSNMEMVLAFRVKLKDNPAQLAVAISKNLFVPQPRQSYRSLSLDAMPLCADMAELKNRINLLNVIQAYVSGTELELILRTKLRCEKNYFMQLSFAEQKEYYDLICAVLGDKPLYMLNSKDRAMIRSHDASLLEFAQGQLGAYVSLPKPDAEETAYVEDLKTRFPRLSA